MKKNMMQALSAISAYPRYTPEKIARLMKKHNLNERSLALIVNVTPYTVRLWLLGRNTPCNPSCRILQLIETDPQFVERLAGQTASQ